VTTKEFLKTFEVALLRVKPGDVIILRTDAKLSMAGATEIRAMLKAAFPNNRSLIVANGTTLEVARGEKS